MTIIKSIPTKRVIHNNILTVSDTAIVSEEQFQTNGETFILVKGIAQAKIRLNSKTTEVVTIKALTNVIIIPDMNSIDEEWDEISLDNGACVELRFLANSWYIISSDGLKLK